MASEQTTTQANKGSGEAGVPAELLEVLVCPVTRSKLRVEGAELVGEVGGLRYPVREGIPVLLAEEAALPEGVGSLEEFEAKYGGGGGRGE